MCGNENHCCATCEYSQSSARTYHELSCSFAHDELENCGFNNATIQMVLVQEEGLCANYECDERKFFSIHGRDIDEDHIIDLDNYNGVRRGTDYPFSLF